MMNFLEKCVSLAMSIASKGITNKKVFPEEKKLRVLSCFGNSEIPQCEHLQKSKEHGGHYCGGCGCGDKKYTQLLINGTQYSKLDYPYLKCPMKMPGFSNYQPASPKEVAENSRKAQIEVLDILKLENIKISNPDPSPEEYMLFHELSKIKE